MIDNKFRSRPWIAACSAIAVVGFMMASVAVAAAYSVQEESGQSMLERRDDGRHRILDRIRALSFGQDGGRMRLRERPQIRVSGPVGSMALRSSGSADRILAMADDLELTDAQRQQIRDAQRAHRRAEIGREAQIDVAELDLQDLMSDVDDADLGAVEGKMKEISDLRIQARIENLRLDRQVRGVLTSEQRDELDERRGHFMLRRSDRDGPMSLFFGEGGSFEFRDGGDFEFGEFDFDWLEDLHPQLFEYRLHERDRDDEGDEEVGHIHARPGARRHQASVATLF